MLSMILQNSKGDKNTQQCGHAPNWQHGPRSLRQSISWGGCTRVMSFLSLVIRSIVQIMCPILLVHPCFNDHRQHLHSEVQDMSIGGKKSLHTVGGGLSTLFFAKSKSISQENSWGGGRAQNLLAASKSDGILVSTMFANCKSTKATGRRTCKR